MKDYPSLYQPGMRNRYPLEVQAQHQREAYSHLREVLGQMVGHIALRELGADYVTIPDDWSDEMVEQYATARELAFPNSTIVLHRRTSSDSRRPG